MRHAPEYLLAAVLLAMLPGRLHAQSLADVARTEEVRRKSVKGPAKVYTNEDLGITSVPSAPQVNPPQPSPPAAAAAAAKSQEPAPADETKSEKYWKDRATALQRALARHKVLVEALQTQVNGLSAEYLNTDDPGQRGLLQQRLQVASSELQRVQQDIEKQTRAAADLQEEARRAGVPSGWVR